MSKTENGGGKTQKGTASIKHAAKKEIKQQESPIEKALRLSSEQVIAQAIRDLIKRDDLN